MLESNRCSFHWRHCFWGGGYSALGTWIAAARSWASVFSVIPEKTSTSKHMAVLSWPCAWAVQTCISTGCKHAGEIPPVASQIQVCFPLEWNLHTYADFVFTWKAGTHRGFGTIWENSFKSLSLGVSEPLIGFLSVPQAHAWLLCVFQVTVNSSAVALDMQKFCSLFGSHQLPI